jgi:outer membrane lipoprotein carrier protein
MRLLLSAAALLVLAARPTAQLTGAGDLAARIQQRYDAVKDFQGDFVQTYEGGVLRTKTSERGTVAIKRPGRMRWVYTTPEKKEFVSDGVRIYSYLIADRQVIVSPAPAAGDAPTPALFLSGQTNLARDFTATNGDFSGAPAGLTTVKLVSKRPDPDYEWIGLGVDAKSLQVKYLIAADRQGGRSAFTFQNLKENVGLPDKFFEFKIPRGVDVVSNGARPPQ